MKEKKFNLLSKFKVYFGISKDINLIFESFVNFFFRNFNLLLYKKKINLLFQKYKASLGFLRILR